MSVFFDPTGRATYGIALCARCSLVFSLEDLYSDPNAPGLMVCKDDLDELDPYRLPARQTEKINLDFVRPDVPLTGFAANQSLVYFILATEDLLLLGTESLDYLEVEPWGPIPGGDL